MSAEKSLDNIVSENLVYYRIQAHFTQAELAEKLEISTPHIANIERKKAHASLSLINKILNLFQITPNDLLLEKKPEIELSDEEKMRRLISEKFDSMKVNLCDELVKMKLSENNEVKYSTPIRPRTKKQIVASSKKNK